VDSAHLRFFDILVADVVFDNLFCIGSLAFASSCEYLRRRWLLANRTATRCKDLLVKLLSVIFHVLLGSSLLQFSVTQPRYPECLLVLPASSFDGYLQANASNFDYNAVILTARVRDFEELVRRVIWRDILNFRSRCRSIPKSLLRVPLRIRLVVELSVDTTGSSLVC
jgi:hypothetical protein